MVFKYLFSYCDFDKTAVLEEMVRKCLQIQKMCDTCMRDTVDKRGRVGLIGSYWLADYFLGFLLFTQRTKTKKSSSVATVPRQKLSIAVHCIVHFFRSSTFVLQYKN